MNKIDKIIQDFKESCLEMLNNKNTNGNDDEYLIVETPLVGFKVKFTKENKFTPTDNICKKKKPKNKNNDPFYKQGHIGYNWFNLQHTLGPSNI